VRVGDEYFGGPEAAPFDGIIVTAAAAHIPPSLLLQLDPNGRVVIPEGPPLGSNTSRSWNVVLMVVLGRDSSCL